MKEFYLWFGWNCERLEKHLEKMAQKGWRLKSASFGITILEYERQEASNVSYCLDFNPKYTEDALTIIKDDHWEPISNASGWWLWEKEYATEKPKLFTDKRSLIEREKRLFYLFLLIFLTQLPLISTTLYNNHYRYGHSMVLVSFFYTVLIIFYVYALIKLYLRIHRYSQS